MRHFTRVAPIMPASAQTATYVDADILFDWHKIEGLKGSAITGIQAIIRGTNGADQAAATLVGMDLIFATSHIPTPSDGVNVGIDVPPVTLGTTSAAVDTPGWFNNVIGYVPIVAADMSDVDLVYLNIASKSGLSIPIGSDLYVAAISKGAFDFRNTILVNEADFAVNSQKTITLDTKDATLLFAPGDVLQIDDDNIVGTIKTVDSATQVTLTTNNQSAVSENDKLFNMSPIRLVLTSED